MENEKFLGAEVLGKPLHFHRFLTPGTLPGSHNAEPRKITSYIWQA